MEAEDDEEGGREIHNYKRLTERETAKPTPHTCRKGHQRLHRRIPPHENSGRKGGRGKGGERMKERGRRDSYTTEPNSSQKTGILTKNNYNNDKQDNTQSDLVWNMSLAFFLQLSFHLFAEDL